MVAVETSVNVKPDPWAAFKRVSRSSGKQPVAKKSRKEVHPETESHKSEEADPHICLECGSEISRGRDYNKKRHWAQKHPDKPNKNYAQYIVPKSNERAKTFLMTDKKTGNEQSKKEAQESKDKAMFSNVSPSLQSETVQRSLEGFVVEKEVKSDKSEEQAVQLQQLQGDLSRVVLMLESLTIPKKPSNLTSEQAPVNEDVTGVMSASNLLEVKHPDIIVQILEDGCRVTCYSCEQFQQSQPRKHM